MNVPHVWKEFRLHWIFWNQSESCRSLLSNRVNYIPWLHTSRKVLCPKENLVVTILWWYLYTVPSSPAARLKLFYPDRFNDTSQIKIFKHFLFTIHNSLIRLSDQVQRQWRIETAIDIGNIYCQTVTVMSRIKILGVVHLHMRRFVSWEYCIGVVLAFLPFLLRYITLFVCFPADI